MLNVVELSRVGSQDALEGGSEDETTQRLQHLDQHHLVVSVTDLQVVLVASEAGSEVVSMADAVVVGSEADSKTVIVEEIGEIVVALEGVDEEALAIKTVTGEASQTEEVVVGIVEGPMATLLPMLQLVQEEVSVDLEEAMAVLAQIVMVLELVHHLVGMVDAHLTTEMEAVATIEVTVVMGLEEVEAAAIWSR